MSRRTPRVETLVASRFVYEAFHCSTSFLFFETKNIGRRLFRWFAYRSLSAIFFFSCSTTGVPTILLSDVIKFFFLLFFFYFLFLHFTKPSLQTRYITSTNKNNNNNNKKKREIQCYNIWIEVHLDIEGVNKRLDF